MDSLLSSGHGRGVCHGAAETRARRRMLEASAARTRPEALQSSGAWGMYWVCTLVLGEEDRDTVNSANNLASSLANEGKYANAGRILRECIARVAG